MRQNQINMELARNAAPPHCPEFWKPAMRFLKEIERMKEILKAFLIFSSCS